MNNSKAPQYYDVGFEKHCLTCAFSKRRSFLMVKFQSRTFPFHFTSLYCRTQLESCLKLFLMGLNQLEGCLRRISGVFVLSIFSPKQSSEFLSKTRTTPSTLVAEKTQNVCTWRTLKNSYFETWYLNLSWPKAHCGKSPIWSKVDKKYDFFENAPTL